MYIYMYIYIHIFIFISVCICIYIHTYTTTYIFTLSIYYVIAAFGNISLDQVSRITSFTSSPDVFQSKIMLLQKDSNIAYGVLLVVRSQLHGPRDGDSEFNKNLEKIIENIRIVIGGCLSNLDLIDTIGFVQKALQSAENMQKVHI
jgi:hypothetical protein